MISLRSPRRCGALGMIILFLLCFPLSGCKQGEAGAVYPPHPAVLDLVRYVNPLIGTVGNGDVFPGADVPFGMVQWSPDTGPTGITRPGGYFFVDNHITGFSLTHLSGAGCVALGDIPVTPTTRPLTVSPVQPSGYPYSARYDHRDERASPGSYSVRLDSGVRVDLTATRRSGFGQFTFPSTHHAAILLNVGGSAGATNNDNEATDASVQVAGTRLLTGSATSGHFCGLANTYTVFFAALFDRSFSGTGTWTGPTVSPGARAAAGAHSGAWVTFDTTHRHTVQVKIGISFVSAGNALQNMRSEDPTWTFSSVRRAARSAWNAALNHVQATGGTPAQVTVFYTALYHAMLHPNVFSDVNGQYMGFDGRVHMARGYTHYANFSAWDIYRTQIPLLAWLVPRRTGDMMQSLVEDARQLGRLPKWPVANGESGEMNGDSAAPIIAEAVAFGVRNFDLHGALAAMILGASQPGRGLGGYEERPGLADYRRLGYVPPQTNGYGAAATTLEYGVDDFAIARMAQSLGEPAVARLFFRRSQAWQYIFNPATGFMQPRMPHGSFGSTFDPNSQDGFVEGDAWQYSWMVPHNLAALVRAMGGETHAAHRLDSFFTQFNTGPTSTADWAGNEVGLEVPWEYDFVGAPWETESVVSRILSSLYLPKPWGIPGNDDLGTMSAWCVWATMGLYPEIPGDATLVMGSPLIPHIRVHPDSGHPLTLDAPGAGYNRPYIHAMYLDGRVSTRPWLPSASLRRGGTLQFRLGSLPDRSWGSRPADAPPSFATGEAPVLGFASLGGPAVAPGSSITVHLGARNLTGRSLNVQWSADVPSGMSLTPSAGVFRLPGGATADRDIVVAVSPSLQPGSTSLHIHIHVMGGSVAAHAPDVVEVLPVG